MKTLELKHLSFFYEKRSQALDDINLKIETDKITLLVGENGAGKSTLINVLTGQLNRFKGEYTIDGNPVNTVKGEVLYGNRFGYAPEIPVLDPLLTGLEITRLVGDIRQIPKNRVDDIIKEFTGIFNLEDWFYNKTCSGYSKGMLKKLSILLALFPRLTYSIMDEPFEGLDALSLFNLKQLILKNKKQGRGCLISSHMLDIAEKISDIIVFIRDGKLLYRGAFENLKNTWPDINSLEELYLKLYYQEPNG